MIKFFTRIMSVLLPAVVLSGCVADEPDLPAHSDECKIVLHLNLRDAAGDPLTRADYDADKAPIPPGELMQNLRIIITDSKGNVEHNRRYTLSGLSEYTSEVFKVKGNDTKKVYFIVNDDQLTLTSDGKEISSQDFFGRFNPGTKIDSDDLSALTVSYASNAPGWNSSNRQIPMAAVASAYVADKTSEDPLPVNVDLHRAATKFSYRILNDSPEPLSVDSIHIGFMADKEFLFPNSTTYGVAPDGTPTPTTYKVPEDVKLSDFSQAYKDVVIPSKKEFSLPSIYFTEGERFTDSRVYWTTISVNGATLEKRQLKWRYPEETEATRDMKDLPRNSHIVVEVRIKDKHDFTFSACVEPFAVRELYPDFGLERKEDGTLIYRDPDGWLVSDEGYFDTPRTFHYIDARGYEIPAENVTRDEDGHVIKIRDFEGYNLSKNGYPLDDTGVEGYRDDGDDGAGTGSRVRNHDGYIMDKDGHLIDADGNPATRTVEEFTDEDGNKYSKVVVRDKEGYIIDYEGYLVDIDGNPCERKEDGTVVRISDNKVIGKDGKPVEPQNS